jgi:PPK2 family polyphosphate:nucleotide phosphotransferase
MNDEQMLQNLAGRKFVDKMGHQQLSCCLSPLSHMSTKTDLSAFRHIGKKPLRLAKVPTRIKALHTSDEDYELKLNKLRTDIHEMQIQMYAHNRYGMLVVFQAMDAAGKDSTIEKVFSGVNPVGVEVHSFKAPTSDELDHDFLWRTTVVMPPRGKVGVFNRSYYEEVLVCKVHPEIITKYQRLPEAEMKNMKSLYQHRYESICDFEKHAVRNGIRVVKIFIHVSKAEQAQRFLDRIEDPSKNWKFNEADLAEREHWDEYMTAYEDAINKTATPDAPWYVLPADSKKTMRLLVAQVVRDEMKKLHLAWPEFPTEQKDALLRSKVKLEKELGVKLKVRKPKQKAVAGKTS